MRSQIITVLFAAAAKAELHLTSTVYTDDQCKVEDASIESQTVTTGSSEKYYACDAICIPLGNTEVCNYHRSWCALIDGHSNIVTAGCGGDSTCGTCKTDDADLTKTPINVCQGPTLNRWGKTHGLCSAEVAGIVVASVAGATAVVGIPLCMIAIIVSCWLRNRRLRGQSTPLLGERA